MLRAQVDRLRDDVFEGSVFFDKEGVIIELDARPSDAIALAIGNDVPIFVAEKVIERAAMRPDGIGDARPKPKADPIAL